MEYRKNRKTPDVMLLANNQRKMHGVPMWRKKNKKKRQKGSAGNGEADYKEHS